MIQIKKPDNAVVLLQNIDRKIVVVKENNGLWTLPGGKVDSSDIDGFAAAKREYLEETGNDLPELKLCSTFVYKNDSHKTTNIYICKTMTDYCPRFNVSKTNGETTDLKCHSLDYILAHHKQYKSYAVDSLQQIFNKGYLTGDYHSKYLKYKTKYSKLKCVKTKLL